ncbi:apolipoprotein N-acyltransferase [Candidatus Poribacteria bacterium]|nr:apolipoprotein N-acyltransferase [Candidatus Poribacteria bacterium]
MINKIRLHMLSINPYFLSIISGILLTVSFPNFNLSWVAWFSVFPLLIAIENSTPKAAFWIGYLQGMIFTLGSLFWVKIFHFLALPAITLVFSIYFGIFAWLYNLLKKYFDFAKPLIAAISWISVEYLRSSGFFGLTWNILGYSQFENIYLIQFANLTGVAGISFLIMLVNGSLADFILNENKKITSILLCIALILLALIYGKFSIPATEIQNGKSVDIGIVQGNFNVEQNSNDYYKLPFLKDLSNSLAGQDIIIWTESVILDSIFTNPIFKGETQDIARYANSFLLIGNPTLEPTPNGSSRDFNSAYLINPKGEISDRYDKIHLVPFGEVFPLSEHFKFIKDFEAEVNCSGFLEGEKRTIFKINNKKNNNIYFATLICYEGAFGDLTRKFVKDGAEFLVNITNDSWSKSSTSHYQHAIMSIFRAIENRVYLVRAANTGISFIVDPYGRITKKLDLYKRGTVKGKIFLYEKDKTFYTKYGDIFTQICAGMVILLLIIIILRRIKCHKKN